MSASAYNLNQGQEAAADAFMAFLFSDEKGFIISGPAGVGKTYLMNYIIDQTMPRYEEMCNLIGERPLFNSVHMTATTNKAAEVLATSTGRPTSTIHSFLALIVKDDFSTGRSKITKTNNWRVRENEIIFIDECSMIDSDLFKIIQEGTHKCKIVYVGDRNQLAPVFEKLSPVYTQGYQFYELTQQMRNSGQPALMNICQQLRTTVETDIFNPIQMVPGVIDHLDDDQIQAELLRIFAQQTKESRILAYTNKQVNAYNEYIRNMRKLPTEYMVGELLVNNSAIKLGKTTISVEEELTVLATKTPIIEKIAENPDGSPINLEVQHCDLESKVKGVFRLVPVPADKDHFAALLRYFSNKKDWVHYYHLKNNYPDLRARDAATVHKSQGSTYDSVFIDLANISTCTHKDQVARMLYVAFSRAKNRVFLYGKLADKYGGMIL